MSIENVDTGERIIIGLLFVLAVILSGLLATFFAGVVSHEARQWHCVSSTGQECGNPSTNKYLEGAK